MCITSLICQSYAQSTSKTTATEENKSAVTDHAISLNHDIDCNHAIVIDRESNRMERWIRETIHIRKEQDKSIDRHGGSYQLPHIYDYLLYAAATPGGQSYRRRQQRLLKGQQNNYKRLYCDLWGIFHNFWSYVSTFESIQRHFPELFFCQIFVRFLTNLL